MDRKAPSNAELNFPTGVEVHGGYLRIWFMYRNVRCREPLSIPPTKGNIKKAGLQRSTIVYQIKTGQFNYAEHFPESKNLERFTDYRAPLTISEIAAKWLDLKKIDLSNNTCARYTAMLKTCVNYLGPDRYIASLKNEDFAQLRNDLLNGPQNYANRSQVGRTVRTVNVYLTVVRQLLEFALINNYIENRVWEGIGNLKKTRVKPDPLTADEIDKILAACLNEQDKNLINFAIYSGLRHGELISLAWEDVDLDKGVVTVNRNLASIGEFVQPKTVSGERTVKLLGKAKEALIKQRSLTLMHPANTIDVVLREKRATRKDVCTFVFNPKLTAKGDHQRSYYFNTSIEDKWTRICRRAQVRRRAPYQTRHTFACLMLSNGANPAFIAAQMGHSSTQMVFNVYGDWIPEQDQDQLDMLDAKLNKNAPYMPHQKTRNN